MFNVKTLPIRIYTFVAGIGCGLAIANIIKGSMEGATMGFMICGIMLLLSLEN